MIIGLELFNGGSTPAYFVTFQCATGNFEDRLIDDMSATELKPETILLLQGAEAHNEIKRTLTTGELADFLAGSSGAVLATAQVKYQDVFDQAHYLRCGMKVTCPDPTQPICIDPCDIDFST